MTMGQYTPLAYPYQVREERRGGHQPRPVDVTTSPSCYSPNGKVADLGPQSGARPGLPIGRSNLMRHKGPAVARRASVACQEFPTHTGGQSTLPQNNQPAGLHERARANLVEIDPAGQMGGVELDIVIPRIHLPLHKRRHLLAEGVVDGQRHVRAHR